jgi:uncharacterized protein DUF6600
MSPRGMSKIPAPVSLAVFAIGAAAIVGAVLLFVFRPGLKNGPNKVEANDAIPFAARLDRLDGDVGIARQTGAQDQPYQGWTKATVNAPLSLGDRIYVKDGARAAVALGSRKYVRLNPRTSLDVVSITPGHTELALREGACVFDVGALDSGEVFEVGTPNGAVDFTQPGLYQVGIEDTGDLMVSVLNGAAHVAGLAGSGDCGKGQLITLAAADAADAVVSDLSPSTAGSIVDDYYSYRYPTGYDHRYADYQRYEEDPDYNEETYRRSPSYQYIPESTDIAGVEDLDEYGDWEDVPNYGHCWRPRGTSADWAPYRDGYWSNDNEAGLTWVSNEKWGWAPYHYGRWAHVGQNWYWVAAEATRQPVYAPALVAFVSAPRADEVGWVPLGPGDPYVPRYYDRDYRPHYVGSSRDIDRYTSITKTAYYNDPGAVTVVSVNQFTQVITPAVVHRPDAAYLASTRPVVEPFAVPVLRQLAPTIESSRPAVPVSVEVHQAMERPVVMRQRPVASPVATNLVDTLKVQSIPEDRAKRKLEVRKIEQPVVATTPNGLPEVPAAAKLGQLSDQERQARIASLQAQAAQGNKAAKREVRQLEEQQRQAAAQQALAQQQAQTEQKKAERQQAQQAEQQRQAQAAQQVEQRKAERQAARQAQQNQQQQQAQTAQQAEQLKAQKQAARQQAQQAEQQRQAQAAQQAEQRKAEKQAARQQEQQRQTQANQQSAQQAEQRKAERQSARQQAEQQRQAQAAQQAAQQTEQRKAQQRAADQQAQQEAARQQALREQRKIQKQAQQQAQQQSQDQAQQQRQQQKEEKRAQRQSTEQPSPQQAQPQVNSNKAEKKAERAKKNKNSGQ